MKPKENITTHSLEYFKGKAGTPGTKVTLVMRSDIEGHYNETGVYYYDGLLEGLEMIDKSNINERIDYLEYHIIDLSTNYPDTAFYKKIIKNLKILKKYERKKSNNSNDHNQTIEKDKITNNKFKYFTKNTKGKYIFNAEKVISKEVNLKIFASQLFYMNNSIKSQTIITELEGKNIFDFTETNWTTMKIYVKSQRTNSPKNEKIINEIKNILNEFEQ